MDTADGAPAGGGVVEIRGARLWYRDEGEGPAVVLVHAGVADLRMWDPLVDELGGRFRTIRFDMRGYGSTFSQPGEFSPAADLELLFQALALDEATVVGASFGGVVALEFAAVYPQHVARLVLLDAGPYEDDESDELVNYFEEEAKLRSEGRFAEAIELNVATWTPGAAPEIQELVRRMQTRSYELQATSDLEPVPLVEDLAAAIPELAMPVVVAYGERDLADFAAQAERMVSAIPTATLHPIEGAAHLPALEQPAAVARLIAG